MAKNLRQDITGLRAIAVLAVTLFHIDHVMLPQINLFKGGFLGVDIFFVISGFLMTMLIMRKGGGLQSGDFSLLKFYQRRAKRICPALIATLVFFLALGYFIFSPEDLKNAGREASKAVLFISNYYFAKRAGYFDTVATDKLFLHTWSLSVEWQFYIVYPFILMLAYRFLSYKNIGRLILGYLSCCSTSFRHLPLHCSWQPTIMAARLNLPKTWSLVLRYLSCALAIDRHQYPL